MDEQRVKQLRLILEEHRDFIKQLTTVHQAWFAFIFTANGAALAAKVSKPESFDIDWILALADGFAFVIGIVIGHYFYRYPAVIAEARSSYFDRDLQNTAKTFPAELWAIAAYSVATFCLVIGCAWISPPWWYGLLPAIPAIGFAILGIYLLSHWRMAGSDSMDSIPEVAASTATGLTHGCSGPAARGAEPGR